jgi:hypothetical protein
MSSECQMPEPTPEHMELMKSIGVWDVTAYIYMDPSAPPTLSKATDTVEAVGPFWLLCAYRGEFMGSPYRGQCQVGYNEKKGVFTSTWIDQMTPTLILMEGNKDESGKMILKGEGPGMTGELETWRYEQVELDENSKRVEMFIEGEEGDVLVMAWDYVRRT